MPEPGEQLRLMHVHAHPDDEASKGAATTARYVAEGVDVRVVTCTGGERGDVLNAAVEIPEGGLAEVRREEMARSAQILGVSHRWLGFADSGYPQGDPRPPLPAGCFADVSVEAGAEALAREIVDFRPHVVTTYDEQGGYPHPDHVRCHEVTVAALTLAAARWQVAKLYYHQSFHRQKVHALHSAALANGYPSPYAQWVDDIDNWPDNTHRVTTRVECAAYFAVRDEALLAHATQIDPEGHWFALPTPLQQEVWPTEDYELAISHVPVEVAEDDLFAGLRPKS